MYLIPNKHLVVWNPAQNVVRSLVMCLTNNTVPIFHVLSTRRLWKSKLWQQPENNSNSMKDSPRFIVNFQTKYLPAIWPGQMYRNRDLRIDGLLANQDWIWVTVGEVSISFLPHSNIISFHLDNTDNVDIRKLIEKLAVNYCLLLPSLFLYLYECAVILIHMWYYL